MYRIDKFLEYYNSLSGVQTCIDGHIWVHARPLPFYHGFLTKGYWKQRKQRRKDAKAVLRGDAVAVTWKDVE